MSAPTKRTRKPKPTPAPTVVRPKWQREYESGWVVRAAKVRTGGADPQWMVDYDRAPASFGRAVGLTSDLQLAKWFNHTERELAERTASWQLGHVKLARRDTDTGIIEEVVT